MKDEGSFEGEAEQISDKRATASPGKESWNSAKPFLTCREGRVDKEGLGQEEGRKRRKAAAGEEQAPPPGT
jgi:hypothetical protein